MLIHQFASAALRAIFVVFLVIGMPMASFANPFATEPDRFLWCAPSQHSWRTQNVLASVPSFLSAWDPATESDELGRHTCYRPKLVQSDCHQSMHCEFGFGCIDTEFVAPRYWRLREHWHDRSYRTFTERDEFLFVDHFYRPAWRYTGNVWQDYMHFYSREGLGLLAIGLGVHAILANTSLDQDFRDSFQDNAVGDPDAFAWAKVLGATWVVIPGALGLWAVDECIDRRGWFNHHGVHQEVGGWVRQTCRALLVGASANFALQLAIGASRPTDAIGDSQWRPFNDNNGVSGHTFVGAIPLLVAAKRTDNFLLKSAFILGSGLAGYSRIYDDAHYLSQVLLGYYIAVLAVDATELTQQSAFQYRVVPINAHGGVGIGVEFRR